MYYVLLTVIISSLISVLSLAITTMLQIGPSYQKNLHPVERPTASHTEYLLSQGLL